MMRLSKYNRIAVVLFAAYTILQVYCINQLTINNDESLFASYGVSLLKGERNKDVILFDSKLPVTAVNMIPRAVEQVANPELKRSWPESIIDIIRGRYISLIVSILLGLLILKWTRKLFNPAIATGALLLYLVCPNFLAHGIFVSSDIYACFFITAAFYYLWKFCNTGQFTTFVLMSLAVALGQISKFTLFHLFILVPIVLLVSGVYRRKNGLPVAGIKKTTLYLLLFLFINWVVISASHLFFQLFVPVKDYHFISATFRDLQHFLTGFWPQLPVPLPSSYVRSMDAVMYFDQLGGGEPGSLNGPSYLLGESSRFGFWYYYFVVIFFKVPISILILWTCSLFFSLKKISHHSFFRNDLFLVFPVIYYLVYLNFFYNTQLGIRHVMIIFPFLFVLSGILIQKLLTSGKPYILYALFVYLLISVFSYFPHFLPYTNEFLLNKKLAYKKISDTNISYGEGRKYLDKWMKKNPGALYEPERPVAGKIIVGESRLNNIHIQSMHKFDWLRDMEPVDHIHSQYLVFELTRKQADSLTLIYNSQR